MESADSASIVIPIVVNDEIIGRYPTTTGFKKRSKKVQILMKFSILSHILEHI